MRERAIKIIIATVDGAHVYHVVRVILDDISTSTWSMSTIDVTLYPTISMVLIIISIILWFLRNLAPIAQKT
jgi:hypothetical protein